MSDRTVDEWREFLKDRDKNLDWKDCATRSEVDSLVNEIIQLRTKLAAWEPVVRAVLQWTRTEWFPNHYADMCHCVEDLGDALTALRLIPVDLLPGGE